MDTSTDVIVIGAGLAGLAAARLVTRNGLSVHVLDGHAPGGRATTDVLQGFAFNRGPHAWYLGGAGARVMSQLGIDPPGLPPAGQMMGQRADVRGALPVSARSVATTSLLGLRGRAAVARLLGGLSRIDSASLAGRSFADWLDGQRLPADAHALVQAVARLSTYVADTEAVSADAVVAQLQLATSHGVRYLDGGWSALVDSLAAGLRVERATVAAVEAESDGAEVVLADGTRHAARAVIVAGLSPAATARLLGRAPFDVGPAAEAACLDLGTQRPSSPSFLLGIDRPLYLSTHCPPARLAPQGAAVVHVARYLREGEGSAPDAQRAELASFAASAGLPADDIVVDRYLHRMTVMHGLPVPSAGGLAGRPGVHDGGVPGVFIAGDWVGPEGLLADASLASAAAAAEAVVRRSMTVHDGGR